MSRPVIPSYKSYNLNLWDMDVDKGVANAVLIEGLLISKAKTWWASDETVSLSCQVSVLVETITNEDGLDDDHEKCIILRYHDYK